MTFNDMAITAKIKSNFASDQMLNAMEIDIDTENGVVTLKGKVPDSNAKNRAEQIAMKTGGVKQVQNDLNVAS